MTADLQTHGIAALPPMPPVQVQAIMASLADKPVYHGHVKQRGLAARPDSEVTCWSMDDVVTAPHFFEYVLALTDVAAAYLGQRPLLYSLNAFTTYPSQKPLNVDIHEFHRDRDDVTFLALFVYLTDVLTSEQGAHQFQVGTHRGQSVGPVSEVFGPAGTAFLADTRGLHRGLRPSTGSRILAWARWGVSNPPRSYVWDGLTPVARGRLGDRYPTDTALQDSIRLVVQ